MQRRAKRYVRSDVLGRSENLIQHGRVGSIYLAKRVKNHHTNLTHLYLFMHVQPD